LAKTYGADQSIRGSAATRVTREPFDEADGVGLAARGDPLGPVAGVEARQAIGYGIGHVDLLSHPQVYAKLRAWLSP